jgi:hypothetical protein
VSHVKFGDVSKLEALKGSKTAANTYLILGADPKKLYSQGMW